MRLVLDAPRLRGEHIAVFKGLDGVEAPALELRCENGVLIAERDPSSSDYHLILSGTEKGISQVYEVAEIDGVDSVEGIAHTQADNSVEVSLRGSPFFTFNYGKEYPKPFLNPILTPARRKYAQGTHGGVLGGRAPVATGIDLDAGSD